MKINHYIERERTISPSQDYEFLRKEGLKYIENLAHKTWSDYNAHDPGITIEEVLVYAITELGYRTNFNIKDLLANKEGIIENKTFFTARNILTNAPLTNIDYRKLIIDIEGINNAWIITHKIEKDDLGYPLPLNNELPIYINPKEDKLSLSDKDIFDNQLSRLGVRGLNKIIVELSEDIDLGVLNDVRFDYSWYDDNHFVEVEIIPDFNNWNDAKANLLSRMNTPDKIEIDTKEIEEDHVKIIVKRSLNNTQTLTFFIKPFDLDNLNRVKEYFNTEQSICTLIDNLTQKKKKVDAIYIKIQNTLNQNRNLTEDWLCVDTIKETEIGICTDIELENEADAEEVIAKVQMAIDLILNPPLHFYTLNQMLDKGYNTSEIFNGPALEHGFLIDKEVNKAKLPDCIYASDIIATIMDVNGVKSISNLLLTAYDSDGIAIDNAKNKSWCLPLKVGQKPVFSYQNSKLLLFREGIPFLISEKGNLELKQGVHYLKTENNNYKLKEVVNDYLIPKAKFFQLDDYYSVQYEFPTTYGIGKGQLSNKATNLRKSQAKQLKAYLQHFDQLLADFFNQLYHAKDLLDAKTLDKTYFPKYINNIDGIDKEFFSEEIYSNTYKSTLLEGESATDRSLYESKKLFYNRRNRMLDHLMARFGESFNNYVFMMHQMKQNAKGNADLSFQDEELIQDKQQFLREYPKLSAARGLGINYLQEKATDLNKYKWGLALRGGYENRVARLLGINNYHLEKIVAIEQAQQTWHYDTNIGKLYFKTFDLGSSFSKNQTWELAQKLINDIRSYRILKYTNTYIYFVNKDGKKVAKLEKIFTGFSDAEAFIPKLYQAVNSFLENFYCIEHLLLRPMTNDAYKNDIYIANPDPNNYISYDALLPVCLNDNCYPQKNPDPYSFKATIVLPGWLARFRNIDFRRYAQKTFRKEAPAHSLIKVCWVGREEMIAFQNTYKNWIEAYRKYKPKYCQNKLTKPAKEKYNKSLAKLISKLNEINTIYDEGTLYDCKESELDNPIVLGNSSLGTL